MLEYAYVNEVYGQSFVKGHNKDHGLRHKTARKSGEKEQDDFSRKRNFDMSVTGDGPDSKVPIAATPDARGPSPVLSPYPGSEASIYDETTRLIPPMYEVAPPVAVKGPQLPAQQMDLEPLALKQGFGVGAEHDCPAEKSGCV
ncbi:hypothetical protein KFL_004900013 [Klebsormidium nitens]|uniref:Uncharacterized protein n=1 Tax=Klebsormidium nitens TaxID=105231 RepID=A0A1Y1IEV9_KLENI|nr:hypothetical protein KFL_004900013 [Klebsormidium nitens]|eukprot:GAQ89133.1 hypothetical protein KFL_004900013 [Klebsormidium nitens]